MNHYSDKLLPYLVRGAKVYVYGKLNTNIWYDKNKMANVSLNVMADNVELCGLKSEAAAVANAAPSPEQKQVTKNDAPSDLPF